MHPPGSSVHFMTSFSPAFSCGISGGKSTVNLLFRSPGDVRIPSCCCSTTNSWGSLSSILGMPSAGISRSHLECPDACHTKQPWQAVPPTDQWPGSSTSFPSKGLLLEELELEEHCEKVGFCVRIHATLYPVRYPSGALLASDWPQPTQVKNSPKLADVQRNRDIIIKQRLH